MDQKYNRRDFTKVIGASLGVTGIGALSPALANTNQNVNMTYDKNILVSAPGKLATQTAIVTNNKPQESVVPVHMGVVVDGYYRRSMVADPTIQVLEDTMKELDNAEDAVVTCSGMSTITQTLITLLSSGDTILHHNNLYPEVPTFITNYLARFDIKAVSTDMRDVETVERLIVEHKPKVIHFEGYTNPYLDVVDIKAIIKLAENSGCITVVDNTFMSPVFLKPLDLGADLVIHSMSKYIAGHGDVLGGSVAGKKELIEKMRQTRATMGANLAPEKAYLILRGIRTLALRMPVHCQNALGLAEWLEKHPKVSKVNYPGLKSSVGNEIAKKQAPVFGGLLSFVLKGGTPAVEAVKANMKLCLDRTSLGEPNTLLTGDALFNQFFGTEPGFVRVAVGLEGIDDIIKDIDQALS